MGKKIFLVLLVVISVFLTFGCSNSVSSSSDAGSANNSSEVNNSSSSSNKLGAYYYTKGNTLHLTGNSNYEAIAYAYNDYKRVFQYVDWAIGKDEIEEIIIDNDVYFDSEDSYSACGLFMYFDSVKKISGLSKLHIKGDAAVLFEGNDRLISLDVENLNTSEMTSMTEMFCNCGSLNELDISKWNTSKVESMDKMFYGCEDLSKLNIEKWNTSKVGDMSYMFENCPAPRPSWYHE